jgi:hypothetical protein
MSSPKRVVAYLLEPHSLAKSSEEIIVGVRHRVGEIHTHPAQPKVGLRIDDLFAQCSQRYRNLDRGARLKASAQGQSLIDGRKDPAGRRIHHHHRTVIRPEGFDRGSANLQVFAIDVVALGGIRKRRFGPGAPANDAQPRILGSSPDPTCRDGVSSLFDRQRSRTQIGKKRKS